MTPASNLAGAHRLLTANAVTRAALLPLAWAWEGVAAARRAVYRLGLARGRREYDHRDAARMCPITMLGGWSLEALFTAISNDESLAAQVGLLPRYTGDPSTKEAIPHPSRCPRCLRFGISPSLDIILRSVSTFIGKWSRKTTPTILHIRAPWE